MNRRSSSTVCSIGRKVSSLNDRENTLAIASASSGVARRHVNPVIAAA